MRNPIKTTAFGCLIFYRYKYVDSYKNTQIFNHVEHVNTEIMLIRKININASRSAQLKMKYNERILNTNNCMNKSIKIIYLSPLASQKDKKASI